MNNPLLQTEKTDRPRGFHPLAFEADWKSMLLVHFAVAPEELAPHLPLPLDLYEGKAYVSLVFFSFENFRLAGTGAVGRWLLRPLSEHPFLNVRTYVRGPAGPGIFFLAEWITNRLSLRLGPLTHGLPYRLGKFQSEAHRPGGTELLCVQDRENGHGELRLMYPSRRDTPEAALAGSLDAFLLERYTAYTSRRGVTRAFAVAHPPWRFTRPDWIRTETGVVARAFPWFGGAKMAGAHASEGFENVYMGPPRMVSHLESVSAAPSAINSVPAPIA